MYSFIFILLAASRMFLHPLHFSITNIDINSGNDTAYVSYQFFTSDFELILQIFKQAEIDLEQNKELTQQNIETINDYIFSAFEMKLNETEKVDLDFQNKKNDEALIWLYYKGKLPAERIENITLVNELLLDLYEDQKNLVIINFDGEEKGYSFSYRKRVINVEFAI
jgi:hypothetical protein